MSEIRPTILLVGWFCCMGLLAGCGGGDGGGGPTDTAESLTADGWALYEADDYGGAVGKFRAAIDMDANYADAYNGLGWSFGKMDSLQQSVDNFVHCIAKGMTTADPYAGRAPAYRDLGAGRYKHAITVADTALVKSASYAFSHRTSFDYRDLRVIKAQCHFQLKEYAQAVAEINALDGNTVDPNDPEAIAAEIERLGDLYGG